LADGIRLLIDKSKYGVYNIAGNDYLSRYDFARRVAEVFGFREDLINPIVTDQLQQKAPRPMRGGLQIQKAKTELGYQPKPLVRVLEFLKHKMEAVV
jgi:dTDP-4-dehydrorhamnose reductase